MLAFPATTIKEKSMKITKVDTNNMYFSELKRGACFKLSSNNASDNACAWLGIKTRENEYLYFATVNDEPVFVSNLCSPGHWLVTPCRIVEVILT